MIATRIDGNGEQTFARQSLFEQSADEALNVPKSHFQEEVYDTCTTCPVLPQKHRNIIDCNLSSLVFRLLFRVDSKDFVGNSISTMSSSLLPASSSMILRDKQTN